MVEKFEVGKSYTLGKLTSAALPFEILFVGEFKALAKSRCGMEFPVLLSDCTFHDEYHEPKVEKFVSYLIHLGKAGVIVSTIPSNQYGEKPLGKIEITLTDGKLSSVEIVE